MAGRLKRGVIPSRVVTIARSRLGYHGKQPNSALG